MPEKSEDDIQFEKMLGGPSSAKVSNPRVVREGLGDDPSEGQDFDWRPEPERTTDSLVEIEHTHGLYSQTEEAPVRQRFRFELNVGSGMRDLLDEDEPNRWFPMWLNEHAANALLRTLNQYPAIAETYAWKDQRPPLSEQVMEAVEAVAAKAEHIQRYGYMTDDPMDELRGLKKLLEDRGI